MTICVRPLSCKSHRLNGFAARLLALSIVLGAIATPARAQDFHHLSGAQIQSMVVGKRITDDTHWSQTVASGGRLLVRDMGHASTGTWHIKNDRLCIDRPGILNDCYEIWLAGDAIQLRTQGALPLTVFLCPATAR